MRHSGFVRNFESTLRLLCERGHHVHVGFHDRGSALAGRMRRTSPSGCAAVLRRSRGEPRPSARTAWGLLAARAARRARLPALPHPARTGMLPSCASAPSEGRGPSVDPADRAWCRIARRAGRARSGAAGTACWKRCIPVSGAIDAYSRGPAARRAAVSPLIEPGSPQGEYVRAARARGIRTVLCVGSWDNLTNKGLIHGPLDLVTVWNE